MRVTINDDEEVEVGDDTSENYYIGDTPVEVPDSVFKCPTCQTGTVHQGFELKIQAEIPELESVNPKTKRVYLCSNCGRVSTR